MHILGAEQARAVFAWPTDDGDSTTEVRVSLSRWTNVPPRPDRRRLVAGDTRWSRSVLRELHGLDADDRPLKVDLEHGIKIAAKGSPARRCTRASGRVHSSRPCRTDMAQLVGVADCAQRLYQSVGDVERQDGHRPSIGAHEHRPRLT